MRNLTKVLIAAVFVLVLAIFGAATIPNPGHKASMVGGDNDADRTFFGLPTELFTFPGSLNVSSNMIVGGNLTASNIFTHFYNWVIKPDLSVNYLTFNGTDLSFNETRLNLSIDSKTASTTYNASSIATIEGNNTGGNLASIQVIDTDWYNVSEYGNETPSLVEINFTNVTSFNQILIRERYSGGLGHEIDIQTWNYVSGSWESHGEITDQSTMVESVINIINSADHISGGLVQFRFDHIQNGSGSHALYIDYVALQHGYTSLTSAQHDSLLGREDKDNHPWAFPTDASRNITGQINGISALFTGDLSVRGNFNVTGTSYFGSPSFVNIDASGNIDVGGNVTAARFIGDGSGLTGVGAGYLNLTHTLYDGNIVNGTLVGYQAANAICNANFPNSRLCTPDDILFIIAKKDISYFSTLEYTSSWVANGPPGFLANSNDCNGFKSNAGSYYGAYWTYNANGGGDSLITPCSNVKPLGCCW